MSLHPLFTDEHEAFRASVRQFVEAELAPHALRKVVAGDDARKEVSMAKWYTTELDWRVADEALQVHGGYGFMMEFPVQRAWRNSRLGPIGGGTTEVMKEIIGRSFGL